MLNLAQSIQSQIVSSLTSSWNVKNASKPWSCQRLANYFRFEVRKGERLTTDGATVNRSEVIQWNNGTIPFPYDTDVWLSLAMRIPSGARIPVDVNHWLTVGQFHPTFSNGDSTSLSPVWSQNILPTGYLAIYVRSATQSPVTESPPANKVYSFKFNFDTWMNFVYRLQFSKTGGGVMDMYLNGSNVYSDTPPIGYNETIGPYFQFGIYRASDEYPAIIEYANVEVGLTDLTSRIANPLPLPF
jgi:hypothetical protein